MSIGLFGGTFDPVHLGHLWLAREALRRLALEQVILLPAGNPYQRDRAPHASGIDRGEMLRFAVADDPRLSVDLREVHRQGATYTIDTLREWRSEVGPATPLIWLIGQDAFARIHTWREAERLLEYAHLAVFGRAEAPAEASVETRRALPSLVVAEVRDPLCLTQSPAGHWLALPVMPPDISATAIRAAISRGALPRHQLPEKVADYIAQHHLYRSE